MVHSLFGAGLVGRPIAITFEEHFCQRVIPGSAPTLELFGPVNDVPYPSTMDGVQLDQTHSAVTLHFTPDQPGTYFLKGMLAGRNGIVQLFLPVAVDHRNAPRTPRLTPPDAECRAGGPFGVQGMACTDSDTRDRFLTVGPAGPRVPLGLRNQVATDESSAWVLDPEARQLWRYVEGADGGLQVSGPFALSPDGGLTGSITKTSGGRVVSSLGATQVVGVGSDGGLQVERPLGTSADAACLRGQTLAKATGAGTIEVTRLDTGEQATLAAVPSFFGCTGESVWFAAGRPLQRVGTLMPEGRDGGGLESVFAELSSDLHLSGLQEAPFLNPTQEAASAIGSLDGPVFPVLRGDHVELEYYGPGSALSATEHTVLLRDDAGTWLISRP